MQDVPDFVPIKGRTMGSSKSQGNLALNLN